MCKEFLANFAIILTFVFSTSLNGMDKAAVDALLDKMDKAGDPKGISKTFKTQVQKAEITVPNQKIKFKVTTIDKFPDKTKTVTEIPGIMKVIRVFNNGKAWEFSPATGMREITGKELAASVLEVDLKNPKTKPRDIFDEIQVADKTVKVGDYECYELTCTPKKKYNSSPIKLYVDKDKYLLRKVVSTVQSKMGPIKSVSLITEYKNVDGLMVATKSTVSQMNMKMEVKVIETKHNVDIDDSEFEKPAE